MPKKKKATPHLVLATEDAMIGALNRHAELALRIKSEDAANDESIAALKSVHTEQMQPLREELAQLESSIHLFCVSNRKTLFPDEKKKSKAYDNATIGFRLHPHSVATVVKESQETVAKRLDQLDWAEDYVSLKLALNKENLLRDRLTLTPEQLAVAGIKFEQDETFFIEPSAAAADRVTKPAEATAAA